MSYDFLIFDLDGTLVDSQNDLTNVVNLIRADYDLKPLTAEQVKAYLGSGVHTLMERIVPLKQINNQDLVKKFSFYYDKHCSLKKGYNKAYKALDDCINIGLNARIKSQSPTPIGNCLMG